MLANLLPLIALATSHGGAIDATPMRVTTPAAASRELADAIASADSVDFVRADRAHGLVTFGIDRAGEAYELVVVVDMQGHVRALEIDDAGPLVGEPGALSWLVGVMKDARAIVRLRVDDDGQVILVTPDGDRYLAIPHRGPDAAVEARWAASWNV